MPQQEVVGTYAGATVGGYVHVVLTLYPDGTYLTSSRGCLGLLDAAPGNWEQLGDGEILLYQDPENFGVWKLENETMWMLGDDAPDPLRFKKVSVTPLSPSETINGKRETSGSER